MLRRPAEVGFVVLDAAWRLTLPRRTRSSGPLRSRTIAFFHDGSWPMRLADAARSCRGMRMRAHVARPSRRRAARPRAGSRACWRRGRPRRSRRCAASRSIVLFSVTSGRRITSCSVHDWPSSASAPQPRVDARRPPPRDQHACVAQHVVDVQAVDAAAPRRRAGCGRALDASDSRSSSHDQHGVRRARARAASARMRFVLDPSSDERVDDRARGPRACAARAPSAAPRGAPSSEASCVVVARHRPEARRRRPPTAARGSCPGARGRCPSASTA